MPMASGIHPATQMTYAPSANAATRKPMASASAARGFTSLYTSTASVGSTLSSAESAPFT